MRVLSEASHTCRALPDCLRPVPCHLHKTAPQVKPAEKPSQSHQNAQEESRKQATQARPSAVRGAQQAPPVVLRTLPRQVKDGIQQLKAHEPTGLLKDLRGTTFRHSLLNVRSSRLTFALVQTDVVHWQCRIYKPSSREPPGIYHPAQQQMPRQHVPSRSQGGMGGGC